MAYIIFGVILILFLLTDIVCTTLTTRGEGLVSSFVSGAYRKVACSCIQKGRRPSEVIGSVSISTLALVWLAGLWAGWVLVFMGIPGAIAHSGNTSGVELHDIIYFVGFTLSTLGTGDLYPTTPLLLDPFIAEIPPRFVLQAKIHQLLLLYMNERSDFIQLYKC